METKHTPGPWTAHRLTTRACPGWAEYDIHSEQKEHGRHATYFCYYNDEQGDANAALIAASPRLLAALERAERELSWAVEQQCPNTPWANQDGANALAEIRAAIAAAKGEQ
jgi:hypothetical protein